MVKKQLIMEKALELFAIHGFEATSVQQITESCGISKGAFYLSFKSKDELIFQLTDHFMSEIVVDVERSVNANQPTEILLYNYYFVSLNAIQKHADFGKLFMKEPSTSINPELLERMTMYNSHLYKIIHSIVNRQFHEINVKMRPDLVFVIQGFVKHYGELFLINDLPIDLNVLCNALVEKTTILAKYTTIQLISPEFYTCSKSSYLSPTKEQVIELLTQKISEIEDDIIQESLELLKKDLLEPSLSTAIIQGLLNNLRVNSHCKWTAHLYEQFLKNTNY